MTASTQPAAKRKTYVVAGSYPEYCQFLREQHLTAKDAVWLRRPEQIRGVENPTVRYIGNWKTTKDLETIDRAILEQQRPVR